MRSSTNLLSDCHSEMSGERRHKWEGNITELNWSEMGPDSVVDIPTWCGLDGQGIESSWGGGGEVFRTRPDRPWGPPSLLYNGCWVSFPGVKQPERGVNYPPQSSAEVKERIELYFCTPLGLFWGGLPSYRRVLPRVDRGSYVAFSLVLDL